MVQCIGQCSPSAYSTSPWSQSRTITAPSNPPELARTGRIPTRASSISLSIWAADAWRTARSYTLVVSPARTRIRRRFLRSAAISPVSMMITAADFTSDGGADLGNRRNGSRIRYVVLGVTETLTRDQIQELDRVFARGVTAPAVVTAHTLTEL